MSMGAALNQFDFPSSSPSSVRWRYNVFLSFRGEDTRRKFAAHIYRALTDAGINTFFDAVEVPRGEDISFKLLQAIRCSQFAVVIISRNYAESKWCLEELEEIMKWKQSMGQVVLPVFYGVEPSHVRKQLGPFKEAFDGHGRIFTPEKVRRWRAALTEAGNLSGWVIGDREDEAASIEEITRLIRVRLDAETYLHVASFPVGFDSRLVELPSRLSDGSDHVYFLGIVGMAGVGKTSLAKAIYNKLLLHFKCGSFLANVRENSKHMVHLQVQLLRDTTNFRRAKGRISNVDKGINTIRSTLYDQKVVIVLDDVSDLDQMRQLAGGRDWFGPRSRIIVTTRYPDLLRVINVDDVYEVKSLNADESLQLFCSHAFGELYPKEEFGKLSKQVINYCRGLPLALEVLGGSLAGKSSTADWENTLDQLKLIPDKRIHERLWISFDALGDRVHELFLDIACFFVGWDKDYVVMVLEACGLFAKRGIKDLTDKCLIEVDDQNKLQMHAFLRDMGREIVRRQSPNNPGTRSRLWRHEDVLTMLRSHLGTEEVEGIALNSLESPVYANAKAFKKMKRLRVLQLNNLELHGEYRLISKELRLLYWSNSFFNYIPDDFYLEQLVAIDIQHNTLREVFQDSKVLGNLKILNLSYSCHLTRTPNFRKFPNLEKLILKYCTELVNIHPSIGDLQRLVLMNFRGCRKLTLEKFPDSIHTLKSLESFCFSSWSSVFIEAAAAAAAAVAAEKIFIPKLLPQVYFPVRRIPRETNSQQIVPLFRLAKLKALKLISCRVEDSAIPADISSAVSLEYLDLRENVFISLPHSISHLPKLRYLKLDGCRTLRVLPDMPPSLLCLSAVDCWSLRRMSMPHFDYETRLFLTNCGQLRIIDGLHKRDRRGSIHLEECDSLATEFREFLLKDWCGLGRGNVFLPGTDIPKWFHFRTNCSSSLSITVPPSWYGSLQDLTVCVIYSAEHKLHKKGSCPFPEVHIHPLNISYRAATNEKISVTEDDHMWVFHLPESFLGRLDSVYELTLNADFGVGWTVKGLGAYFPGKVLWNPEEYGEGREVEEEEEDTECHFQGKSGLPHESGTVKHEAANADHGMDWHAQSNQGDIYIMGANSIEVVEGEEDHGSIYPLLLFYCVIFCVCWILWRYRLFG